MKYSVYTGILAAVLTFSFSIFNNTFATSCVRSLFAFVIFATLSYVIAFGMEAFMQPNTAGGQRVQLEQQDNTDDNQEVASVNEDEKNAVEQFVPLFKKGDNPPDSIDQFNSKDIADAIRIVSEN